MNWNRVSWGSLLVGVGSSREQKLTAVYRYHWVEWGDLADELAVPLSGCPE